MYKTAKRKHWPRRGLAVNDATSYYGLNRSLLPNFCSRDRLRGIVNIMGDSYGAAIVEHLSRNDLLQLEFESRDPMSEQLADLGTRFTTKCDVYGRVTVQARDDENANERLMDKERSFDENLDDDKPRLTETTF